MQHTLVAVFDNRTDAQNAMNELLSSNFSRQDVHLSNADPTGMTDSVSGTSAATTARTTDADADDGIGASIKHFFTDLFGADNSEHASRYEGAVTRGHHVLTVNADSLPDVERAADIVERYGPTDIDEHASGEGSMRTGAMGAGMAATPESMRMSGAGGMQQNSGMSMQSGTGVSQQLDSAGDRNLFAQQSLDQAEPMGQTYQEPMGNSGLSATGGTSLQGSTLQGNTVQSSSLGSTRNSGAPGSQQFDTGYQSATSSAALREAQRGRSRIYSRMGETSATSGTMTGARSGMRDDDSYYRSHYDSTYGMSGTGTESYDYYAPAYSYGSEMARSSKYSGRRWDQVEHDLRTEWDTRGSGGPSTWEKMKAAVRHGWDRITTDDDDSYYRSHYDSNLSSSGVDYDSAKSAYSYGTEMRKSDLYRNQPWDDIEGDMRKGWDSRISTATHGDTSAGAWDRMKAAVRHGWDRVTDDDDDDRAYRSHWNATYSSATDAGSYDDYKPAYSYGSSMAQDPKYRGRQWGEVENDLRSDWDIRYGSGGQSTWEKMKSAVRHGWDRMTS